MKFIKVDNASDRLSCLINLESITIIREQEDGSSYIEVSSDSYVYSNLKYLELVKMLTQNNS